MARISGASSTGFNDSLMSSHGNAHMYGLSDFWVHMFQDTEELGALLEQMNISMGDAYSLFLYLAGTSSLHDVASYVKRECALVTIRKKRDKVPGTFSTYKLHGNLVEATYLMNRPMLPTFSFENNVHFDIDMDKREITFFTDLTEDTIPSRIVLDDKGNEVDIEYSLWAVNAVLDEKLMYRFYGKLAGTEVPKPSQAEKYKGFIKGLYFLYRNGPVVKLLEQGLSLSLGIPLARATERIVNIARDEINGDHIVITEDNYYRVPLKTLGNLSEGNTIIFGEPLVPIAKIIDYQIDPEWFQGMTMPFDLVDNLAGMGYGPKVFYETTESPYQASPIVIDQNGNELQREAFYLMDNYLKYHSFYIEVKWQTWSDMVDEDDQNEIHRMIQTAKPSYTYTFTAWNVDIPEDVSSVEDILESLSMDYHFEDAIVSDAPYPLRYVSYGEWEPDTGYEEGQVVVPPYSALFDVMPPDPIEAEYVSLYDEEPEGIEESIEDVTQALSNIQLVAMGQGTSDSTPPDWLSIVVGDTVTDGTVTWLVVPKEAGVNAERGTGMFIRGNFYVSLLDRSLPQYEYGYTFDVPAKYNWPSLAAPKVVHPNFLYPLFNAYTRETLDKLNFLGVFPGICLPDMLFIGGVDVDSKYRNLESQKGLPTGFIRDLREYLHRYGEGYTGLGYSRNPLPLPVSTGEAYRVHIPNKNRLLTTENLFVLKAGDEMYSWFLYRTNPLQTIDADYFPYMEVDKTVAFSSDGDFDLSIMRTNLSNAGIDLSPSMLIISDGIF